MEGTTVINFQGNIRYETIGELIHKFKEQAPRHGIPMGIYKRILLILIESLENIMKHSEESCRGGMTSLPELSIISQGNKYIIETSNTLTTENIAGLKSRLDLLNSLDQQGLKNLYKSTITDGIFTNRGGAGLGLIEIVKISGNPIIYEFQEINEHLTRFRQKVTVALK